MTQQQLLRRNLWTGIELNNTPQLIAHPSSYMGSDNLDGNQRDTEALDAQAIASDHQPMCVAHPSSTKLSQTRREAVIMQPDSAKETSDLSVLEERYNQFVDHPSSYTGNPSEGNDKADNCILSASAGSSAKDGDRNTAGSDRVSTGNQSSAMQETSSSKKASEKSCETAAAELAYERENQINLSSFRDVQNSIPGQVLAGNDVVQSNTCTQHSENERSITEVKELG